MTCKEQVEGNERGDLNVLNKPAAGVPRFQARGGIGAIFTGCALDILCETEYTYSMKQTLTAKLKLHTGASQFQALRTTQLAYRDALNYTSQYAYEHGKMSNQERLRAVNLCRCSSEVQAACPNGL